MLAMKCDRCGAVYDIPEPGELTGFRWMSEDDSIAKRIDLCPNCVDALSDWMERIPEAKLTVPAKASPPEPEPILRDTWASEAELTVPEKAKRVRLDHNTLVEVVRDWVSGMSAEEIGRKYAITPGKVKKTCLNFKSRHPKEFRKFEEEAKGDSYIVNP